MEGKLRSNFICLVGTGTLSNVRRARMPLSSWRERPFRRKASLKKGFPVRLGSERCSGGLSHTLKYIALSNMNICLLYIKGRRERKKRLYRRCDEWTSVLYNAMSGQADELMIRDMRRGTCRFLCLAEEATLRPGGHIALFIALAMGGRYRAFINYLCFKTENIPASNSSRANFRSRIYFYTKKVHSVE